MRSFKKELQREEIVLGVSGQTIPTKKHQAGPALPSKPLNESPQSQRPSSGTGRLLLKTRNKRGCCERHPAGADPFHKSRDGIGTQWPAWSLPETTGPRVYLRYVDWTASLRFVNVFYLRKRVFKARSVSSSSLRPLSSFRSLMVKIVECPVWIFFTTICL